MDARGNNLIIQLERCSKNNASFNSETASFFFLAQLIKRDMKIYRGA